MIARALIWLVLLSGCASAHASAVPVSTVETTSATIVPTPSSDDLDSAPQGIYAGHTAYLVRDRWYYRDAQDRWHAFIVEPDALLEQRHEIQARTVPDQTR